MNDPTKQLQLVTEYKSLLEELVQLRTRIAEVENKLGFPCSAMLLDKSSLSRVTRKLNNDTIPRGGGSKTSRRILLPKGTREFDKIRKLIKSARIEENMSQRELAETIGVGGSTIDNIENGRTGLSEGIFTRLLAWRPDLKGK